MTGKSLMATLKCSLKIEPCYSIIDNEDSQRKEVASPSDLPSNRLWQAQKQLKKFWVVGSSQTCVWICTQKSRARQYRRQARRWINSPQPDTAGNPSVKQPGLVPFVMSWNTSGCLIHECKNQQRSQTLNAFCTSIYVLIKDRMDESDRSFASFGSLFVNKSDNGAPDWRSLAGAALSNLITIINDGEI